MSKWMAAWDINNPAELVAKYGDPGNAQHAAQGNYAAKQRAGIQPYAAYGWATYLECAVIRQRTQGEAK